VSRTSRVDLVVETYDGAAADYGQFMPEAFDFAARSLLQMFGSTQGKALLDVGAGPGIVARIASEFPSPPSAICNLDVSRGMAVEGASRDQQAHWICGDASALPFRVSSFDLVTCTQALPFFEDPREAIDGMCAMLRPAGQLGIVCKSRPDPLWRWDYDLLIDIGWTPSKLIKKPWRKPSEFDFMTLAGFKVEHKTVRTEVRFSDLDAYWGLKWSSGMRVDLAAMPSEVLAEYVARSNAFLSSELSEHGYAGQDFEYLLVHATKQP